MRLLAQSILVVGLFVVTSAIAQQLQPPAPKTKLEAFTGEIGAVLLKGYSDVGTIKAQGEISVTAMMFKNAKSGQETKGIVFEVYEPTGSYSIRSLSTGRSYIDYDEINGLVDGIDYISQADENATPYPFFEAKYSTRGDLKITVFNDGHGKRSVAVNSGSIGSKSAYISTDQLASLRRLILRAKEILDDPVSAKAKADRPSVTAPVRTPPASPVMPTSGLQSRTPLPNPKPGPPVGIQLPNKPN